MAAIETPASPTAGARPALEAAIIPRTRLVAMTAFAIVAGTWWLRVGIPADPFSTFAWLWFAAIAWRWGAPLRRHLDFARDWWPALATLLFYTYTRGFADGLGIAPHERMPIVVDRWIGFGELPTQRLQHWLCGSTCADMGAGRWYDTIFTATYASHFVCGLILAVVLWLGNREQWVRWMRRYLALNLAGLSIYVIYPMVPPWMASDNGAFTPAIERMTGRGGSGPGLQLAQIVMGPIGNTVAAMPSLHAGTACLVAFYGISTLRTRLRWLLLLYPLTMTTALVYFGEHYVVDALAGAALAGVVMVASRLWEQRRARAKASVADQPVEDDAPTPAPRCPGRHRRTILLSLVLFPVWAVVCTGVLETPLWWDQINHGAALFAVLSKPLDVLFVLLVLLLLWCVTGRLWLSMGLLLGLAAGLSAVNVAKMSILTEPLYPSDYEFLHDTRFLLDMVKPASVVELVVGLVVLVVATILASRRLGRRYPRVTRADHPRGWAALVGTRLIGTLVLLLVLSSALHFNDPGNPWRKLYDAHGAIWEPFSQAMNYRTNGFVGGALYNMPGDPMPVPVDYSAATMQAIAQKYAARADARNADRSAGALDGVNVVLVLSEAFGDLSRLKGLTVDHDTMPLTRQTIAASWGGSTLANFYGTGTSSMEFEALTGQSLGLFNPQVTAPYQNFMTSLDSYPSAVGWFADHGHLPIAVHPYHADMYRRNAIYPMLGFQDFVHDSTMSEKAHLQKNEYISDASAFDEVAKQLKSHGQPLLVNLVTMQNHVPTLGLYDDPVPVEAAGDRDLVESVGDYARGQEYSDQALHTFLGELKASGEPTVVVFYGDHYPGVLPDEVLDANPGTGQLETPMFIWSTQGQPARALPVTSPADFLPHVFDLVGEPRPPYYELLSEVAEKVGAIGPGRIVAPDGTEETEADLTPAQQRLLHDYRLVQYDFSIGQRYAVDDMFYDFGSQP